ncbi:hypothetical protein ACFORJ_01060 [Corynebacterium hansenii]|uniref:Secreted protein n=1 Tax=Corynebacterium hansenii TaxID=394964 RepID=A0ABV7ZNP1_9CORY|nr:hypothetical protein [Corynebacterium hansenii]WJY99407.1 hypothetical protein CHAN_03920 [Corynebacterium hansenii]
MYRKLSIGLLAAAALMVLPACSGGDVPADPTSESGTNSTTGTSDKPKPTSDTSSSAAPGPNTGQADAPTSTPSGHMGYTGAPTGDPTPINKSIARCAKLSEGLYERGTTWFTDGTSGWTQYCSNNFYDGPPPVYEPREPYIPPAEDTPYPEAPDYSDGQGEQGDVGPS